jgi:ABC-type uncharacterized transport system
MRQGRRKLAGWTSLAVGAVLMFAVWVLLVLVSAQPELKVLIDLSPQARFTVSRETKELLRRLREDPNLRCEFHTIYEPLPRGSTEEERQIIGIHQQLQRLTTDLLSQYAYHGGESVKVFHHDVLRNPAETRQFVQKRGGGRNSVTVILFAKDKSGKESSRHKSLSVDKELGVLDRRPQTPLPGGKRPPRLQDYRGEAALSGGLKGLLVQGAPKIYLLTGHREEDVESAHWASYSELMNGLSREGFQFGQINLAKDKIPDDAEVLACFEPRRELSDEEAEKILAFLRGGGRMFLNASYETTPVDWNPTLKNLLAPLGLELGLELVCQPYELARMSAPERVVQLRIRRMNPVHPITQALVADQRAQVMQEARDIRRIQPSPAGVNVDMSLLGTDPAWLAPRDPSGMPDLRPPNDRSAFRLRCVGAIVDVLPPEQAPSKQRTGRLVVLSGKALVNGFYKQGQVDLGLNIFQWLAERQALVTVRREPLSSHSLPLAEPGYDPDRRAAHLSSIRWLLRLWVPGFLLGLGVFILWRRSRL